MSAFQSSLGQVASRTGRRTFRSILAVLGLLTASVTVQAADFYYVGPDGGNWNNPLNWSSTPGGPPCACTPQPGDRAFVTGNAPLTVGFDSSYASPLLKLTVDGAGAQARLVQSGSSTAMRSHDWFVGVDGI